MFRGRSRRPAFDQYKAPGRDGPRARAAAAQLLAGARTLDNITVDTLVASYQLKPATAQRMLEDERARRARRL